MLTEEAHHMFVGQTGIRRVIQRSCELMNEHQTDEIGPHGGISLKLLHKFINFWYSSALNLFGAEKSTNAADYFATGVKGRAHEARLDVDHVAKDGIYNMSVLEGGQISSEDVPLRNAMNEVLRDDYVEDCNKGVKQWNRDLENGGMDFRVKLPSRRFNRDVGLWSEARFDPEGNMITDAQWQKCKNDWLPTAEDKAFVKSLMVQVTEPGKMAGWIAPPRKGINDNDINYNYVKL
jgi:benzoyl-CoA 2,3-dioxygenase component B